MKARWTATIPFMLGALFVMAPCTMARAESAEQAIYDDAKDLVKDVITAELAKSGTEFFVCLSPDKLPYFLPETIKALHENNLAGLGYTTKKESSAVIGEWVKQSVLQAEPISPRRFLTGFGSPIPVIDSTPRADGTLGTGLAKTCAKRLEARIAPYRGVNQDLAWFVDANPEDVSDRLNKTLEIALIAAERPLSDCAMPYEGSERALSCEFGLMAQAAVLQEREAAWEHLIGIATIAVHEASTATLVGAAAGGVAVGAGAAVVTHEVAPELFYKYWLKAKVTLSRLATPVDGRFPETTRRSVEKALRAAGAPIDALSADEVLSAVLLLQQLHTQKFAPASVQQAVLSLLQVTRTLELQNPRWAKVVRIAQKTVARPEFLSVVHSLKSGSGAQILFGALEGALLATEDVNLETPYGAGGKAVLTLLRYASQTKDGSVPSPVAREAAKDALYLYMTTQRNGGFASAARFGWEPLTVSLKATFSPGYSNSSAFNHVRYRPGAELMTAKLRLTRAANQLAYTGLHVSLADWLAPVSEWVLRDQEAKYINSGRAWLNAIASPRIELVFGVPAFSRKLALFAGAGIVMAAPLNTAKGQYTYEWIWTPHDKRPADRKGFGEFGPQFLDAAIGIRYFPF